MMTFTPLVHKEAYVTAIKLTEENEDLVFAAMSDETIADKLASINIVNTNDGADITYRYKTISTAYTLSTGMYLVKLNTGIYFPMTEEELFDTYELYTERTSIDNADPTVETPEEDLFFSSAVTITNQLRLVAKSINGSDFEMDSIHADFITTGDVELTSFSNSGTLERSVSNAGMSINTSGKLTITDAVIGMSNYNAIEIGLSADSLVSEVLIENVDFTGSLSNNAILVFAHAENAVITIRNCHFAEVSNMLRISNRGNVPGTFNIIDCTIDKWESGEGAEAYFGPILCQDYTSASVEDAAVNNLFAPEKITVNIQNLTGPTGEVVTVGSDPAAYLGSADAAQLLYVFSADAVVPYSAARFPTVVVTSSN